MAIVTEVATTSYRDAKGWIKRYRYFVTGDNADANYYTDLATKLQALQAAITGVTNAAVQLKFTGSGAQGVQTLNYGTNAEYRANWMQARMMFTDDKGTKHVFGIGAPPIALFDSDGVTVLNDGSQAAVVAYVNAIKNAQGTVFVSTEDGTAFTHFVGGILKIGTQPKRFAETIKSSHLVQGEGE